MACSGLHALVERLEALVPSQITTRSVQERMRDTAIDDAEIARYVEQTQISGMLIAVLASALGEERVKPIADSEYWQHYIAGKRGLTEAKAEIDRLTELIDEVRRSARQTERPEEEAG